MSPTANELPLIDFEGYISPGSTAESRAQVIAEVRDACARYGFFQLKGHGVPLAMQQAHLQALSTFFSLPKEEKMKLSFLKDPCRRGYESSGDSLRDGDALPDSKEVGCTITIATFVTNIPSLSTWDARILSSLLGSTVPTAGLICPMKLFVLRSGSITRLPRSSEGQSGRFCYRVSAIQLPCWTHSPSVRLCK